MQISSQLRRTLVAVFPAIQRQYVRLQSVLEQQEVTVGCRIVRRLEASTARP